MSGFWVFVCGPSGAGKDSVMRWAQGHLAEHADIVFARRMVTRPPQIGSDHDPVTAQQFAKLMGSGGLVWCWQAHGFHYGIAARYAADVAAGRVVVVNGSREHVICQDGAEQLRVVQVLADQTELQQRLERRGRDEPEAVLARLARNARFDELHADCNILNQGDLAQAGAQLQAYLLDLAQTAKAPR